MTDPTVRSDPAELVRLAADWLERGIVGAIADRGICALGLSGGKTPEPVYRELASRSGVDWRRVEVYFGDERAVPPEDTDSNYGMISSALLSRVPISSGHIHRMEAERPDRDAAAREYERLLPGRLDVLFLGMGADGHTASLFPGAAALDERDRLVLPIRGPVPPTERLTITPPVIERARRVAVMVVGQAKAAMVARALTGPLVSRDVPAQLARAADWFLDPAAAARLTARGVAT